jgi:hypothetical protein
MLCKFCDDKGCVNCGLPNKLCSSAEDVRKELSCILETSALRGVVIVADGNKLHYAYTNMGPGGAMDALADVRRIILENEKATKAP